MRHRRSGWIWACRVAAGLLIGALVGYFWIVGMARADDIAVVLTLIVALAALAAPYLFPIPGRVIAPDADEHPSPVGPTPQGGTATDDPALRLPASGSSAPSPARPARQGDLAEKNEWVRAVMAYGDIADPGFRAQMLDIMGDSLGLGHRFSAEHRDMADDHVREIVSRCWRFKDQEGALAALAEALTNMRPEDAASGRLATLLAEYRQRRSHAGA